MRKINKPTNIIIISASITSLILVLSTSFLMYNIYSIRNNFALELHETRSEYKQQINQLKAGISQDNKRRRMIIDVEKIISSVDSTIPYEVRYQYSEWIVDYSELYDYLDPILLTATIATESHFKPNAESVVGARGLGQIMPLTAQDISEHLKLAYDEKMTFDPKTNIKMTAWYLNRLIRHYGSVEKGLAYYNGGSYNAYRYGLKLKFENGIALTDEEQQHLSRLAPETENYVPKILTYQEKFISIIEES